MAQTLLAPSTIAGRTPVTTGQRHAPILWCSIAIALLVAVTAVAGIFWPATYARETAYYRPGAIASDLVDLLVIVPVVLISGILAYRGSLPARLVWLGAQGYLLYNFVLYAFGVHFNALFLVYSATLGLCFYATAFSVPFVPGEQIARTYGPRALRKTIAVLFLLLTVSTAAFDLREDIPAIMAGRVPQTAIAFNLPVNFVHVLDLVFLLPTLCITAILLLCRKALGYTLAPICLTAMAIMSIELAAIMALMGRSGLGMDMPMIVSFAALAVGCTVLLWLYFSRHGEPKRIPA